MQGTESGWLLLFNHAFKTNEITTFSNGYLGSRNDEERSEMRYVMRIAELRESSKFWTQVALPGTPGSMLVSVSVTLTHDMVRGLMSVFRSRKRRVAWNEESRRLWDARRLNNKTGLFRPNLCWVHRTNCINAQSVISELNTYSFYLGSEIKQEDPLNLSI